MSYDPSIWFSRSLEVIADVHAALPSDISFEERAKAIREAYPFGERKHHPYKMWLKAQRQYLARYAPPAVDTSRFPLSPLERMMRRAGR